MSTRRVVELFKYCKREHLRATLDIDELRIGTVYDWRRSGAHGELVSDSDDGRISLPASNVIYYDYRFHGAWNSRYHVWVTGSGADEKRHFKALEFSTHDRYVFSASTGYSDAEHRQWAKEEKYNACYRISDADEFFGAISAALTDAAFEIAHEALYIDDSLGNLEFKGAFHPALLKRAEQFHQQHEYRAIWAPRDQSSIEPKLLTVPGIQRLCSVVRVLG